MPAQTFIEVSRSAGIDYYNLSFNQNGGGGAFFDYDNDGWLDIYVSGGVNNDRLYRNNRNGTFTDVSLASGVARYDTSYTMGVTTGDIDNDGDRDIFVTKLGQIGSVPRKPNALLRNNGNGTFTDISQQAGITQVSYSVSAAMGDYNLDGWLDIYVVNYIDTYRVIRDAYNNVIGFNHTGFPNFLYRSNGNGTFTEAAASLGVDNRGTSLATAFSDYDNDGDPDILLVNDFGPWVVRNRLFRNEYPADSFTDVSTASGFNAGIYGMGIAVGDYNEDGFLDYYLTNIGHNVLHRNNGIGTFQNAAFYAGVTNGHIGSDKTTGWGAIFLDYDNDSWLDLFVADGYIASGAHFLPTAQKDPNKLYRNNGNGTFTDVSEAAGVNDSARARGAAAGDFDNDGDMDLLVINTIDNSTPSSEHRVRLYRNDLSTGNHWLKVKVVGTVSNRDGFGARLILYSSGRKWCREIDGGSSFASQNSSIAHFGLGTYDSADSLVVIWPGGNRQPVYNTIVDRQITVIENGPYQVFSEVQAVLCAGDSIFAGGSWRKNAGTYLDTLGTPAVFDSIVKTRVSVIPPKTTTHMLTLCEGDSIFAGGTWRKAAGTYYDYFQASTGCDSVVTTSVAVIPRSSLTVERHICSGDSFFAGGAYQTAAGTYYDYFQASTGCDSTVVTVLAVASRYSAAREYSICEGDSLMAGGAYQTTAGLYYDSLRSSAGCDSIVAITLHVQPAVEVTRAVTIAHGDSAYAGGAWQTLPGIYSDTFLAAHGCDSIVLTDLHVAVTGMETSSSAWVTVYPNPARSFFIITFALLHDDDMELRLSSPSGKTMKMIAHVKAPAGSRSCTIQTSDIPPGIYIVSLKTSRSAKTIKVALL